MNKFDLYSPKRCIYNGSSASSPKRTKSVTLTIDGVTYEGTLAEK